MQFCYQKSTAAPKVKVQGHMSPKSNHFHEAPQHTFLPPHINFWRVVARTDRHTQTGGQE